MFKWLFRRGQDEPAQRALSDSEAETIIGAYGVVLESATDEIIDASALPATKERIKAALLHARDKSGPDARSRLESGFVFLSSFATLTASERRALQRYNSAMTALLGDGASAATAADEILQCGPIVQRLRNASLAEAELLAAEWNGR